MTKIQTVNGPISPDELGWTLSHEHLVCSFVVWQTTPEVARQRQLSMEPISLGNRGKLVRDAGIHYDNLNILDLDLVIKELKEFRDLGGKSLVEMTDPGAGRDAIAYRRISNATGLNIICSSGFYIGPSHPPMVKGMDTNGVKDFIVKEITEGITYPEDTGIKAGIIKCATLYPISSEEEKVFKGAARAQAEIGAPFCIHPTLLDIPNRKKVFQLEEIITMIQKEGANLEKFYMNHSDLFISNDRNKVDISYLKKLLDKYSFTADFDTTGNDATWNTLWPGALFCSDNERILAMVELCEQGYEKQMMLAQDTFTKLQLQHYGGYGYSYLQTHVIPRMKFLGVSDKQIRTMTVDNPKKMLAF